MYTHSYFDELINQFAHSIGLPGLSFDDDQLCHLEIGDDITVALGRNVEDGELFFFSVFDEPVPETLDNEWVRHVLQTALSPLRNTRMPALGLDKDRLVAYFTLPVSEKTTAESIGERLLHLAAFRRQWSPLPPKPLADVPRAGGAPIRMA